MGYRFRKSINCGLGFRINLSQSGIGWSWGGPGYRITHKANGGIRKTYSFPGTGLSYVEEESSKKNQNNQIQHIPKANSMERYNLEHQSFTPVVNGKIDSISSPENKFFVNTLKKCLSKIFIIWLLGYFILTLSIIIPIVCFNNLEDWIYAIIFSISFAITFPICILLTRRNAVMIEYNIDNNIQKLIDDRNKAIEILSCCSKLWNITDYQSVVYSRVNAGCNTNVTRKSASLELKKLPFFIKTINNDKFYQLKIDFSNYIFLPDKILLIKFLSVAALKYSDIIITLEDKNFVETQFIPNDGEFLYNTWQYVNNNGTPDRRFNNNRQLPVYRYKGIYLSSNSGLNIHLMASSAKKADNFDVLFNQVNEIF